MHTSAAGRAAITSREGCRLTAYRDNKGIPTIGVGHVDATPPVTVMGMTITKEQADMILANDLAQFERVVNASIVAPLSQNAFDALMSLAFNIGAEAFAKSTVARLVRSGDMPGAADAFLMWNKPAVLLDRRRRERAQFLRPDTVGPDRPFVPPPPIAREPAPSAPSVWARIRSLFTRKAA